MLRVTCHNCKHEFVSTVVNPGKVSYRGCKNVFQLEFNVKIPCPNCRNILGLVPISHDHAKGVPTRQFVGASLERTETLGPSEVEKAGIKLPPSTPTQVKTQVRPKTNDPTQVKPFRVLASDDRKSEPLRLQVQKNKVVPIAATSFRKKQTSYKPLKIFMYAASALIVSSLTAFTMFSFKNSMTAHNEEIAMESLGDEDAGHEEAIENDVALGGPTEDLVVDKAAEDTVDLTIPDKYKKNILYLPNLKKMSSGFGIRLDPFTRKMAFHGGVDFKGKVGDSVEASLDGIVVHAGPKGRYGKIVIMKHGKGIETRYAHLSRVSVKKGQKVKRGQIVGKIGNSGRSTGPHLHLEVIKNGQKVNPLTAKVN